MSEIKLTVHPFEMDTLKEAAKKVQEEAGEAFAEYVILQEQKDRSIASLADEIADTIQASCNLAARYGINLQAAMERCERRNRDRGRYEDEDANPCGIHDGNDCNCGRGGGAMPDGDDAPKSPEEMSVEELIEALYIANGGIYYRNNSCSCTKNFGRDWCRDYGNNGNCTNCRESLLDLMKERYQERVEGLEQEVKYHKEISRLANRDCEKARKTLEEMIEKNDTLRQNEDALGGVIESQKAHIAKLNQQVSDLTHERDGLHRRLAELDSAGITSLHRLLRKTVGEAKNVTDNAQVYIDKQRGINNERCGDCGSIGRNHGGDCGAERVGEHILSAEPPAQEMSEREKVLERLRGYAVYMSEPPSENANRLFACITGNKDARIACKDDIESTRDKLVELLSTPGWDYCETCELVKSDDGE